MHNIYHGLFNDLLAAPMSPRCVCPNPSPYFNPAPIIRSIPICASQIKLAPNTAGFPIATPAANSTSAGVSVCALLYSAAPSVVLDRYPTMARSGASSPPAKIHQDCPENVRKAQMEQPRRQAPSTRRRVRGQVFTTPLDIVMTLLLEGIL